MKFTPRVPINESRKRRKRDNNKPIAVDPVAAAIEANPEIAKFKEMIAATHREPRVRELAQLAATLATGQDFKNAKKTDALADRAFALWKSCANRVRHEYQEELEHIRNLIELNHRPQPSELEFVLHFPEDFPIKFEIALELIVGSKVRRADRYKTFRDFTRDAFRKLAKNDEELEEIVADKFAQLQAKGFDYEPFKRATILFQEWKATRASRKASKAAQMRWSKK